MNMGETGLADLLLTWKIDQEGETDMKRISVHQINATLEEIIHEICEGCPANTDSKSWNTAVEEKVKRLTKDVALLYLQSKRLSAEDKKVIREMSGLTVVEGGNKGKRRGDHE